MRNFIFRCIMAVRTETAFRNFMRNTRYQMLECEYDLEVMKELYRNKEVESKRTLSNNIKSLQDEYDGLWLKFKTQNDEDKERMEDLFLKRRAYYDEKAKALEEKIELLEIRRVEIEHKIKDLKNGKYKAELANLEKLEKLEAEKAEKRNNSLYKKLLRKLRPKKLWIFCFQVLKVK